jgi:hypothetical protein
MPDVERLPSGKGYIPWYRAPFEALMIQSLPCYQGEAQEGRDIDF